MKNESSAIVKLFKDKNPPPSTESQYLLTFGISAFNEEKNLAKLRVTFEGRGKVWKFSYNLGLNSDSVVSHFHNYELQWNQRSGLFSIFADNQPVVTSEKIEDFFVLNTVEN